MMRQIQPIQLPADIEPKAINDDMPEMRLVDPASILVDDDYQRGLSERSMRLIQKIVREWSWDAFKPPVCAEVDGALHALDGQHTAIAAVSHGGIPLMPVMVRKNLAKDARANAFVRHNRDRIAVTPTQLHQAMVAAGDEDALTIAQVCERAGVRILCNAPPTARYAVGETMSISAIRSLVSRRHAAGARLVLEICVKGGAAPVSVVLIRAVEHLLFAAEYKDEIDAERIILVLSAKLSSIETEAQHYAFERKMPLWRALAMQIYIHRKKVRHG